MDKQSLKIKPQRKIKWVWLVIPGAILALLVAAIIVGAVWYNEAIKPPSDSTQPVTVTVARGATWDEAAKQLEQKGVIKSASAAMIYMRLHKPGDLKTGEYLLSPNQPLAEIIAWLGEGRVGTRKITILPGKTLAQVRQGFIKDGFSEQETDQALAVQYDHPLFADKPASANLEGYIYPETYFIEAGATLKEVLTHSFDEFQKQLEQHNIRQQLAAKGFTLFQGITLASMVETEVANAADRRQVAQVFLTRLEKDMVLGSDVTYKYAASLLGIPASPALDSPYNTRIHKGLPPGPVANINVDVLEALADPAPGDYLYFVSGDDGVTHFSHTFEEHEQNIQKYCTKLCFGE